MKIEDLRVQRTHRLLREAFIQLLTTHGYEQLTVRQITAQAQIGYKTFYRHYESKEMLLNGILDELIQDFQKTISSQTSLNPLQNTKIALKFTEGNAKIFTALTQSPLREQLLDPLLGLALQEGSLFLSDLDIPKDLAVYHFASSIHSLMVWWLKNDMPYSIEEMASYIDHLILQPLQQLDSNADPK